MWSVYNLFCLLVRALLEDTGVSYTLNIIHLKYFFGLSSYYNNVSNVYCFSVATYLAYQQIHFVILFHKYPIQGFILSSTQLQCNQVPLQSGHLTLNFCNIQMSLGKTHNFIIACDLTILDGIQKLASLIKFTNIQHQSRKHQVIKLIEAQRIIFF